MAETSEEGFVINGEHYVVDDLTFREQREMRKLVRELVEDPAAEYDSQALVDVLPAFVLVVLRRDDPEVSMESVLDMKLSDFIPANGNGKTARPTKASGTSGRRK